MQNNKFDFPISTTMLVDDKGKETGWRGIRNDDTGEVFRPFSAVYKVQPYAELIDTSEKVIQSTGMPFTRSEFVTCGGARCHVRYNFPNMVKTLAKVGDVVGLRVNLQSSYDGSLRNLVGAGIEVLRCTNGAVSLDGAVDYNKKHSVQFDLDSLKQAIAKVINQFGSLNLKIYDEMADIALTDDQGENLIKNIVAPGLLASRQAEKIVALWRNGTKVSTPSRSIYGVYDAATYHMTHEIEGTRFELANRMNNYVFNRLVKVTRNTSELNELIVKRAGVDSVVV